MSLDTRVAALDGLLEEAGLDAVLATKDASIAYLTGFWGLQMERFFGVVVKRGGTGALIAPTLDRESVNAAATTLDRALYNAATSNALSELAAILGDAP
jgi:Xaa-Pro dipeptidase